MRTQAPKAILCRNHNDGFCRTYYHRHVYDLFMEKKRKKKMILKTKGPGKSELKDQMHAFFFFFNWERRRWGRTVQSIYCDGDSRHDLGVTVTWSCECKDELTICLCLSCLEVHLGPGKGDSPLTYYYSSSEGQT